MKYKGHPNLKVVWYEDINDKFEENVQELANFAGYEISTEKMKVSIANLPKVRGVNFILLSAFKDIIVVIILSNLLNTRY